MPLGKLNQSVTLRHHTGTHKRREISTNGTLLGCYIMQHVTHVTCYTCYTLEI
jgi:hypothetical protein